MTRLLLEVLRLVAATTLTVILIVGLTYGAVLAWTGTTPW